ncbi:MAG: apolipoprotein N-acyltransferase [Actinomycetota bacterium]|nr:apolipoprotein N-acyltransferase [Actinomycetota bacterium]
MGAAATTGAPAGLDPDDKLQTATAPSEQIPGATRSADEPRSPRGAPTGLVVLGGLASVLAFPPYDLRLLAVLAPAALAVAVHRRRARSGAWLGLASGLAFFIPHLAWAAEYLPAWPWLLLALWQSCYLALMGAAWAVVSRLPAWPVWMAALWVGAEALRGRWFVGGFPWGRLGFSQPDGPFTPLAAFGGVPLVSFAVALTGTLLAAAVLSVSRRPAIRWGIATVAIPLVASAGWLVLGDRSLSGDEQARTTIAIVQGDVPQAGLDFNSRRRAVLDNHVDATVALAADVAAEREPAPDLVIWPENSSDIDPLTNSDAAAAIDRAARAVGVPILVGAVLNGPGPTQVSNVGVLWDPDTGAGQIYTKRHPVPFAEYIPARALLERVTDLVDLVGRDFASGTEVGIFDTAGVRLGDLICFEIAYDDLTADVVDAGAGVIVVQTNNATFGFSDETYQQLAMARLRAVEHGRPVVVASTVGISAFIAPDGTLVQTTDLFTRDTLVADVGARQADTIASRVREGPEWLLVGVGLLAWAAGLAVARRARQQAAR